MKKMLVATVCIPCLLALTACGGGAANSGTSDTGGAPNSSGSAHNQANSGDSGDTGGSQPDADLWRKVKIPTPEGWSKLSKDGVLELQNSKYELLKKPDGVKFPMLDAFSDKHAPHGTSGKPEEWKAWRESASACFIFNASKSKDDPVETLKQHGAGFLDGFDASKVNDKPGFAVYIHGAAPEKWLACVSNARGTYILVAIVRNDSAVNLMKPYPASIQPE